MIEDKICIPLSVIVYIILFFVCMFITNSWDVGLDSTYERFCAFSLYIIPAISGALSYLTFGFRECEPLGAIVVAIVSAILSYLSLFIVLFVLTFVLMLVESVGIFVVFLGLLILLGTTPSIFIIIFWA